MSYFEPNEKAWELMKVINENRRTIDNLDFYKTNLADRILNPELDADAVYAYFPKHIISKKLSWEEYSQKESVHAIFVAYYMFDNRKTLEEAIVHELIHFFDFNNIRFLYNSHIGNVNRRLTLAKWKVSIDADAFSEALADISHITRHNQQSFINPLNIENYMERFPDAKINYNDSTLTVLRKIGYEGGKHKYMSDVRAFIGTALYMKYAGY
jgi:hypothetical protein